MSEDGKPNLASPEAKQILDALSPDAADLPSRLKRFMSFCEGESHTLDRADAHAVLTHLRDMGQRVLRQATAIHTMQESMVIVRRALGQGVALIDAFNDKMKQLAGGG